METTSLTENGDTKYDSQTHESISARSQSQVIVRLTFKMYEATCGVSSELIHSKLEEAGCHLVREHTTSELVATDWSALRDQLGRMVADRLVEACVAGIQPQTADEPAQEGAITMHDSQSAESAPQSEQTTTDKEVARLQAELEGMRAKYDRLCATLAALMPGKTPFEQA